jgi:putative addiction module component (TIGR02574 family)
MGASIQELGLEQLTREQRIKLAIELWESLGDGRPSGITEAQLTELHQRDAELQANPSRALSWEQIRAAVEEQR